MHRCLSAEGWQRAELQQLSLGWRSTAAPGTGLLIPQLPTIEKVQLCTSASSLAYVLYPKEATAGMLFPTGRLPAEAIKRCLPFCFPRIIPRWQSAQLLRVTLPVDRVPTH